MPSFSPLQHQIISCILAENEKQDEVNPLTPYLYVLSGGLLPDMHFTLCRDTKAGLVLYVEDPGNSGEQLRKRCGELCLMACLFGGSRDIFFPKLDYNLNLITFSEIAEKYLENRGYEPVQCATEDEARSRIKELKAQKKYPVYFFKSDTTGEKDFEEFYTGKEVLDMDRFKSIGIIKNELVYDEQKLGYFTKTVHGFRKKREWTRTDLIELFNRMIPEFSHQETGKFLDGKM